MHSFDVAIAGGGLIGSSIALELALAKLRVIVFDRQEPGREASWAAAGMLSPGPDSPRALPLVPLGKESLRRYPEFLARVESISGQRVPCASNGTLELFFASTGVSQRDHLLQQHATLGLAAEAISLAAARELEPSIGAEVSSVAWLPKEQTVEPRALVDAVIAACKRSGVEFRLGQPVTSLTLRGKVCDGVNASGEAIHARHVIIAAGGFCSEIEFGCGSGFRTIANFAPTNPVRGQMLALRHPNVHLTRVLRSEQAYLVPRLDGRLIAGSTLENAGFDKRVTPEGIRKILDGVRLMVPALHDSEIVESWAGLRPGTPDELPIIGKTPIEGFLVATGHYRNGVLLAPATAGIIRDLIFSGKTELKIDAFSPLRFSTERTANAASQPASAAD
jgi:glycine oxidase